MSITGVRHMCMERAGGRERKKEEEEEMGRI